MTIYLREWRKAKGFTLKGLGETAGVGFVTLSRAENGHQSLMVDTVEKIAQALGIAPGKLFEPPPKGKTPTRARRKRHGRPKR
ncbi:helix-turn-helix domain-containing protein [Nitrospinota bacterium]